MKPLGSELVDYLTTTLPGLIDTGRIFSRKTRQDCWVV